MECYYKCKMELEIILVYTNSIWQKIFQVYLNNLILWTTYYKTIFRISDKRLPILLLYTLIGLNVVVIVVVEDIVVDDDDGQSLTKHASVSLLFELASLQLSRFSPLSIQYEVRVRRPQLQVLLHGDHSDQASSNNKH